jgi:hypothetical protein
MVLNLKVIGYYNHFNVGDEQYKDSFTKVFKEYLNCEYDLAFVDCDQIFNYNFNKTDIIILGGGDVLNNYFLDKINKKFKNSENLILAVSVGLPYIETLIKTDKLDIIDYIFLRTTVDIDLFKKYFFEDRIFYLPDLSYCLFTNHKNTVGNNVSNVSDANATKNIIERENSSINDSISNLHLCRIKTTKANGKQIVCFCLSRHIYNKNENYQNIIKVFSEFIVFLVEMNYHIVFLPFNTNATNSNENDIIIHNDVLNYLLTESVISMADITFINNGMNTDEIQDVFNMTDLCIAMRFHACLFSFYTNTPIIPIFTTRKIKNLVYELDWKYKYELPKNAFDIPTEMNLETLFKIYWDLQQDKQCKSANTIVYFNKTFEKSVEVLIDCLTTSKKHSTNTKNNIDKMISDIYDSIIVYAESKGYDNFRYITDANLQRTIVNIVSYRLTNTSNAGGIINSEYNYGLQEKMFNTSIQYDHVNEWKWIIDNELHKEKIIIPNNDNGLFDMKYIDQEDYSGSHRSGWQYVYKNLEILHNNNSDLLLDLYVDRTFHWNLEINRLLGIVPYKRTWIGFIHHTFDETFSSYNCNTLLNCKEFIESLDYCKGIFVLSKYLKNQFDIKLKEKNLNIKVYYLMHPTELNVKKFSYENFNKNKDKRLIHIGGWLRNIYSFYNVSLPEKTRFYSGFLFGDKTINPYEFKTDSIKKIALRGKNMNNYYPDCNFLLNLESILDDQDSLRIQLDESDLEELSMLESLEEIENTLSLSKSIDLDSEMVINLARLYYLRQYRRYPIQNISISPMSMSNLQKLQYLRNRDRSIQDNFEPNCSYQPNCSIDNRITNNWNKHFYDDISQKVNTMEFIEFLDNEKYDTLITENIVYINLVDASAVNTMIECIVRSTPIIVNKHPAVVELLGEKYPLYLLSKSTDYNSINIELNNFLQTDKIIRKSHLYLKRLKLKPFNISTFINQFAKILKNIKHVAD